MGARASKEVVSAAARTAVKTEARASAAAVQAAAPQEAAGVARAVPPEGTATAVPAVRQAAAAPALEPVMEMNTDLIKAMNELGPAVKSMRSEAQRTKVVKLVNPFESLPGQISEKHLVRIVGVAREPSFALETVAKEHGVAAKDLEKAISCLAVPRLIQKTGGGGQTLGVWP